MTRRVVLAAFIILQGFLVQSVATPQATTVFAGMPQIKIAEGGVERLPENLTRDKAVMPVSASLRSQRVLASRPSLCGPVLEQDLPTI
jgi:O-acetyl-ADP-ribose deacetylase (regulator of RNase III)